MMGHWFLIPVLLCGALVGADAVRWLGGRLDVFDPVGIIGLLGLHFFFVAPLLHVHWDFWMRGVQPPDDWRDWLGAMAALNVVGLVCYRFGLKLSGRRSGQGSVWTLDRRRLWPLLVGALLITGALQAYVYMSFGGLGGFIQAYTNRYEEQAFEGMGWVFMLAESFPILALIGYAAFAQRRPWAKTWLVLLCVIAIFIVLKIFFGGLRGSRSNTVWGLFWAVGIIHFWIRAVPRRMILAGLPLLLIFMYGYGLYKGAGADVLRALEGRQERLELEARTSRGVQTALLADLGRSDVQAYLLYQLARSDSDYELGWGRTYVGALAILVPRWLLPDRPQTKVKEGTDLQHGVGTYSQGRVSSRVYGLAGEAMLNFGALAVPVAFLLWGFVVGEVKRRLLLLHPLDVRWLLVPLVINLCFVTLVGDSDNIVFFLLKNAIVPFGVLFLCSHKVPLGMRNCNPKKVARYA
jgi:hypothetical protein